MIIIDMWTNSHSTKGAITIESTQNPIFTHKFYTGCNISIESFMITAKKQTVETVEKAKAPKNL